LLHGHVHGERCHGRAYQYSHADNYIQQRAQKRYVIDIRQRYKLCDGIDVVVRKQCRNGINNSRSVRWIVELEIDLSNFTGASIKILQRR